MTEFSPSCLPFSLYSFLLPLLQHWSWYSWRFFVSLKIWITSKSPSWMKSIRLWLPLSKKLKSKRLYFSGHYDLRPPFFLNSVSLRPLSCVAIFDFNCKTLWNQSCQYHNVREWGSCLMLSLPRFHALRLPWHPSDWQSTSAFLFQAPNCLAPYLSLAWHCSD